MNNQYKIDCSCSGRVQIQQTHGLIGDSNSNSNSEFGNRSSLFFDINQAWNTAAPPLQPPYAIPAKSSTAIISRFESPASAFYATERCMGFPLYDSLPANSNPHNFSRLNDSEFPLYQSDPSFQFSNTLQAMLKSHFTTYGDDRYSLSSHNSDLISSRVSPAAKLLPIEQHKLFIEDPYKANQEHAVPLTLSSRQEKLSPTLSSPRSGSNGTVVSSKTRIRWTQDLHDKFVECVNRLGGAEKATPKAILKLMDSDGLTIFHVKSHLQKYRIAKYMPDSAQGKSDKRTHIGDVHHLDAKTGSQIREALHLQLDVQRRLHEQLEIQRKLQLRIEEQGRQLKMMFDQQQKTSKNLLNTQNLSSTSNDDTSNSLKDVEVSITEDSRNSFFPSKTS